MSLKFSKAFLMSGKDFALTPSITLHHPTIEEILSINGSSFPDYFYWGYVQTLLADPYANMVMLDDMGRNYLDVSPYEVFALQWDHCNTAFSVHDAHPLRHITEAISFFIKEEHCFEKGVYEDGSVCFYDRNNPACQINEEIFGCLHEWVRAVNKIENSDNIRPADENARRILIEDMRDTQKKAGKRKKKQEEGFDYLGSLMSAVSFCGNGSLTPHELGSCKLYWLNEALSIRNKKDYADHLLDGIYHGTINSKEIHKKEMDWIT